MKASVYHIQINVASPASMQFYKELLGYFAYAVIDEGKEHVGMTNGTTDFWIIKIEEKHKEKKFHRKAPGLNHIAFKVEKKEDVDVFVREFLNKKKIPTLYQTPRIFPEYTEKYYAVFFEDLERIKLEVVYS